MKIVFTFLRHFSMQKSIINRVNIFSDCHLFFIMAATFFKANYNKNFKFHIKFSETFPI